MSEFVIKGTLDLQANISDIENKLNNVSTQYEQTKQKIERNGIEMTPLESSETKNETRKSYGYMFQSIDDVKKVIGDISSIGTDLPGQMSQAISTLTNGMQASIKSLTSGFKTAGKTMNDAFDITGFNNNVRFQSASMVQYAHDLQEASRIANKMSMATRTALSTQMDQLSSLITPAIARITGKERKALSDTALRGRLQGEDFGYISKFLDSIGVQDKKEQQHALDFAIKTTTARINRSSAADIYSYAGLKNGKNNVSVTDQFEKTYKRPFLAGGRYISEEKTPTNTNRASREATQDYYRAIQAEIRNGNNVAFKAANAAGLIRLENGHYTFAKEGSVLKHKDMLDHFSGLVVQEAKRASQSSPEHFRSVNNPYDEEAILNKDNIALREARRIISSDIRPDANPYIKAHYSTPKIAYDTKNRNINPELSMPETVNIPRMIVRQGKNGQAQFMVQHRKDNGEIEFRPNIDFGWKKEGVAQLASDEFVSMGRNPILDRLIKLHPKTKFENRSFLYGFDEQDKAISGTPLIIDMPLDALYEKDTYKNIVFEDSENGRTAKFTGDNQELIRKLYAGELKPILQMGKKKIAYRAFAGKLENGGSLKFMQDADYNKIMEQDIAAGILPMLEYFNETDEHGRLINPATGKGFINTVGEFAGGQAKEAKDAIKSYARFFDARNKILSHSIPIEELGGKTPSAALVNFDAFYEATKTPREQRFDGGAFIDPNLYSKDFQARMGPAKFLAQRFGWREWFKDSGLTDVDAEGKHHFYMPGMSATATDYATYKAAHQNNVVLNAKSFTYKDENDKDQLIDFGGKTFQEWRDERFVDVMDPKYGMLMSDTALKSVNKIGLKTKKKYEEIVNARKSVQNTSFTNDKRRSAISESGMIPLTPDQQTELMAMMANPNIGTGLRAMKDTENYYGEKHFWSPAYMSSVQMTPSMMRRSVREYEQAFKDFSTSEGIIKRMFSGSDMDSVRVRANPSLIYTDKNIRSQIQSQIEDLEMKQLQGYGYFPDMSQMLLAGVNPAFVFGPVGTDLSGKEVQGDAAKLLTGKHGVIAPLVTDKGYTNFTRSPYAPGANFFSKAIRSDVAKKYHLSDNAALFNPEDFYELNTGDFDGDFVWAYQALKEDKDFVRMTEDRNKAVAEFAKKRQEDADRRKDLSPTEQAVQYQHDAADFSAAVLRTTNAINPIGIGYKLGQAGRVMKLTPEQLQIIDDYANEVYGAAIDQKKDPNLQIRTATGDIKEAVGSRQPFDRFAKAVLEEAGLVETQGAEPGNVDIFKYALPTYFDPMGAATLLSALSGRNANVDYGKKLAGAIRNNISTRYGNRTQEEQDLASWYGDMLIGKLTGEYQISTQDQLNEGRSRAKKVEAIASGMLLKNKDSKEAQDMLAMANRAKKAIDTEEAMGFTEGQLENIDRYYTFNHWRNPILDGFRNATEGRSAILFQEEARRAQEAAILASRQQAVDEVVSQISGKTIGAIDRDNVYDRILTANRFTGFNYSNAKYWTKGNKILKNARYSNLRGEVPEDFEELSPMYGSEDRYEQELYEEQTARANRNKKYYDSKYDVPEIISKYQLEEEAYDSKKKIVRNILTGEKDTNVAAIVGTAAHKYLDTYGSYRSTAGKTREEAVAAATEALEEVLFGEEYTKDRDLAQVSFSRDEKRKDGSYIATSSSGEDLSYTNRFKLRGMLNKLNEVTSQYYDSTLDRSGPEHMIMTEGAMFDDNGTQMKSRRNEGGNGIWIVPTRNGQPVLPFTRQIKGKDGRLQESQAGLYFTPDMIKKNDKGEITIADWKSSLSGQEDALFQMSFYAHQLEELGKQYWTTTNEAEKKDLEWFGQFVKKNNNGTFTSNIKRLQAINPFGENGKRLLTQAYTMEQGDEISKWMEEGMVRLAESAKTGFFAEHPDYIVPLLARQMEKGRSTLAPNQSEKDFAPFTEESKAAINAEIDRINNIYKGGTGVRDSEGNFIDNDKSYLVAKFMKEQEELNEIRSFVNKENKRIFNTGIYTQDAYTQYIDQLKDKFSVDQYDTIKKYLDVDHPAPDLALLEENFTANQVEAARNMRSLTELRQEYVKQLPRTMKTDYDAIKFSDTDMAGQLTAARYKRLRDISALQGSYETNPYYDYENKKFKLSETNYYVSPKRKDGETDEEYNQKVEQAQKDAAQHVAAAEQEMRKYNTQLAQVEAGYKDFSDDWIERLSTAKEREGNVMLSLFTKGSIDKAIFSFKQEASKYERLSEQGKDVGGEKIYDYNKEERAALVAEAVRKQEQARLLESLKGTELENIGLAEEKYSEAKLNATMHGASVDPKIIKERALSNFALSYMRIHPGALPEEIIEAMNQYGATYDQNLLNQQQLWENQLGYTDLINTHRANQAQRQIQYAQEDFRRQRAMGRSSSLLTRNLNAYEQRKIQLNRQINDILPEQITAAEWRRDNAYSVLQNNTELKSLLQGKSQQEAREILQNYKPQTPETFNAINNWKNAEGEVNRLNATLNESKASLKDLGGFGTAAFDTISQSVSRLVQRLGRRIFMKALNEAKQFIKQFDATMTEIQMITLKTDDQMSSLGDGLIKKAKELKISIAEITKSAATLYRQGLSDREVNDRLEVIAKFSKVSGTKTEDATKLITVAMNTGLVTDPKLAADIVTALGDNAATNAAQIEKGIEKAGAAAAADGTTFAELASMLTAITSTTQIGGNVAGRTLNTIFGRMNKIGTNEMLIDENGHQISGSAVAELLAAQGVRMYDEQGKKRSSYSVLYDLSKRWDSMSDAEQQQIATAIAGTRQYSNFAAIMQGMTEGKVDEYMSLASSAEGTTDKKYNIYTKSLQAALDTLKNSFDELVSTLTNNGGLKSFIDFLTNAIQGVTSLTKAAGGLKGVLVAIGAIMAGIAVFKLGMASGVAGIPLMLAGAGLVAGTAITMNALGGLSNSNKSATEIYKESKENSNALFENRQTRIDRAIELKNKGENRTKEEDKEYYSLLSAFNDTNDTKFGKSVEGTGSSLSEFSKEIENVGSKAEQAGKELEQYGDKIIDEATNKLNRDKVRSIYSDLPKASSAIAEKVDTEVSEYNKEGHVSSYGLLGSLWTQDESGEITFHKDRLADMVGQGWHLFTGKRVNDNTYESLIQTLTNFSNSEYASGSKYEGWNSDKWHEYFNLARESGINDYIDFSDDTSNRISKYLSNQNQLETNGATAQYNSLKAQIKEYLADFITDEDQLEFVSANVADEYFSTHGHEKINGSSVATILGKVIGKNTNKNSDPNAVNKSINEYIKSKGGMPLSLKQQEALDFNLEYGDENSYYVDSEGKQYSYEEALEIRKNKRKRYLAKDKETNDTLQAYSVDELGEEEAKAQANAKTRSYFVDQKEERRYYDNNAEATKARNEYLDKEAIWEYSYVDQKGQTQTARGTKEQLKEFEKNRLNQFNVQFVVSGPEESKGFRSKKEALKYQAGKNAGIITGQMTNGINQYADRLANSEARFFGVDDEEYVFYGPEAVKRANQERANYIASHRFKTINYETGETTGYYSNKKDAEAAARAQTGYYRTINGEKVLLGYGDQGLQKTTEEKEFYSSIANKRFLYGNTEVDNDADIYDITTNGGYVYTDKSGKTTIFSKDQWNSGTILSADQAQQNYLEEIGIPWLESLNNEEYKGLGYITAYDNNNIRINSEGYIVDDNGKVIDKNHPLYEQYKYWMGTDWKEHGYVDEKGRYAPFVKKANGSAVNNMSAKDIVSKYGDLRSEYIYNPEFSTSDIGVTATQMSKLGSVKQYIPDLKDLGESPELYKISGQYISTIKKELVGGTIDVFDSLIQVISDTGAEVQTEMEQELTMVRDHFFAGVKTNAQKWKETNANLIASDDMLRVLLNVDDTSLSEQERVQRLFNRINIGDEQEWETLTRSDPELARILNQIERNERGEITYTPQGIMDEITNYLFSKSTFGKSTISKKDKASSAKEAFEGLYKEDNKKRWKSNLIEAEQEYNEYAKNVDKIRDRTIKKVKENATGTVPEQALNRIKEYYKPISQTDYFEREAIEYVNSSQENNLKEILGEELAGKVRLYGRTGGATKEEMEYAGRLIDNYMNGYQGNVYSNYSPFINSLFGGFDTSKWDYNKIKTEWESGNNRDMYQEMLGKISGGDVILKALNGDLNWNDQAVIDALSSFSSDYYKENLFGKFGSKTAQKMAEERSLIEQGTISDRISAYSGYASDEEMFRKARFALAGENTSDNRKIIASALGISDEDVDRYIKAGKKNELESALQEKIDRFADQTKAMVLSFIPEDKIKELGIDVDNVDLSEVEQYLDELPEDVRDFAQMLIDLVKKAKNNTSIDNPEIAQAISDTESEFGRSKEERIAFDWIRTHGNEIANASSGYWKGDPHNGGQWIERSWEDSVQEMAGTNSQIDDIISNHKEIVAAWNMLRNQKISEDEYKNIIDYAEKGQAVPELTSTLVRGIFSDEGSKYINAAGMFDVDAIQSDVSGFRQYMDDIKEKGDGTYELFQLLLELVPDLKDLFEIGKDNELSPAFTSINRIITNSNIERAKKFTDQTKKLKKELSESTTKALSVSKEATNNQFLREQWRQGKKSGDITDYVESLGFDRSDVYKKSMSGMIETKMKLEESKDATDVEDALEPLMVDTTQNIQDYIANNPIEIDGAVIGVNVDPATVSMDTDELLNTFGPQIDESLLNVIRYMQSKGIDLTWDISSDGQGNVTITPKVNSLGSGHKQSKKQSKSGKTKTDALIEGQNHYIKWREHDVNMSQIYQEHLENLGDYSGAISAVEAEIAAQKRLVKQYEANISALKAQLSTLKVGSEEWYKCKEAIDAAEEAMAKAQSTIDQLAYKILELKKKMFELQNTVLSYKRSMMSIRSQKYQVTDDFNSYVASTQQEIAQYQEDIETWKKQREEFAKLQEKYEKKGENGVAAEYAQEVLNLDQQIAQAELNMVQAQQELNLAQIARVTTLMERSNASHVARANVASTFAGYFENKQDYSDYIRMMGIQNSQLETQTAYYQDALTAQQALMAKYKEGSPEWLAARENVMAYTEALATLVTQIDENNRAIQEAKIMDIQSNAEFDNSFAQHDYNIYSAREQQYEAEQDYQGAIMTTEGMLTSSQTQLARKRKELEDYINLLNSGEITDPTEYKKLIQLIHQTSEDINQLEISVQSLKDKMAEFKFTDLVQGLTEADTLTNHRIQMIQYEETKYKNDDQYTNYNTMIGYENAELEARRQLYENILPQLHEQLEEAEAANNKPLYDKIAEKIRQAEEEVAKINGQIESNNKLIEENEKKIRDLQQAVENAIDNEIKNRIKLEREMLDATVANENTILNVIKKRFTDEWALMRKDIDAKKKALSQEKNLINERLNARKKAIDEEDKYEQLAELQKQLALISADPTRTKEAKELRKKISDLQKDISWDIAGDQANAQMSAIDDQITAMDEYVSTYEEDLNEMLQDANNFSDEIATVLGGSFDEYVAWLKENDEAYKNSSESTRKQMEQGWKDSWNKMKGYVETYWDTVEETMRTEEGFVEYMKQSQQYQNASDVGKIALERSWQKMYQSYANSTLDNATFNHEDDTYDGQRRSEIDDWIELLHAGGVTLESAREFLANADLDSDTIAAILAALEGTDYTAADKEADPMKSVENQQTDLLTNIANGTATINKTVEDIRAHTEAIKNNTKNPPKVIINIDAGGGGGGGGGNSGTTPGPDLGDGKKHGYSFTDNNNGKVYSQTGFSSKDAAYDAAAKIRDSLIGSYRGDYSKISRITSIAAYSKGGLADYTGLAMVHGSKTNPEAFLSATDTKLMRSFLNAFDYISTGHFMSPTSDMFSGSTNVGDINITINQAELKNDADYDDVARRIGKAFTREMSKSGLNLSAYSF